MKKTSSKSSSSSFASVLKAIQGFKFSTDTEKSLTNTAWQFAYSVLWNSQLFSEYERTEARSHINEFLTNSRNPTRSFLQFCQRMIVARQHINELDSSVCLPSLFLDSENPEGFAKTKAWFDPIKELRRSLPNYKIELKALAEAILEVSEQPSLGNFRYWRSYFIDRQEPVLLELFTVFCCNQVFNVL
jgi:hypothetical protein